jgi:hypothetical protein
MLSGQVLVHRAESQHFRITETRLLWSMGRGFSGYVERIENIERGQGGALNLTAAGHNYAGAPGVWQLTVEPDAAYLVTSASFIQTNPRTGERSAQAEISITTTGVKWLGSWAVPEGVQFSEMGGRMRYPVAVLSLEAKPDRALLDQAKRRLGPPFDVPTTYRDLGVTPPFEHDFKAGETFQGETALVGREIRNMGDVSEPNAAWSSSDGHAASRPVTVAANGNVDARTASSGSPMVTRVVVLVVSCAVLGGVVLTGGLWRRRKRGGH